MTRPDALILIQEIEKLGLKLNGFEQGLIQTIKGRLVSPLSAKQSQCLVKIYEKAAGHTNYERRQVLG
jgi:hypothetical protein